MRRMLLMSMVIGPAILAILLSSKPDPRRRLRDMVLATAVFTVLWTVIGSRLYFLFRGD
jgi:hypothetical protein